MTGRSPNFGHVSRTHRVDLDWLFERLNVDSSIRYGRTTEQLTDILTKGAFTTIQWKSVMRSLSATSSRDAERLQLPARLREWALGREDGRFLTRSTLRWEESQWPEQSWPQQVLKVMSPGATQRSTHNKTHPQALLGETQRVLRNKEAQTPTLFGRTLVMGQT